MAQPQPKPQLTLVSGNREPDPFVGLKRAVANDTALPSRTSSAAFGFSIGVTTIVSALFVAGLPVAWLPTFALLVGLIVGALGVYQWLDPAPRQVWDVRVGGAWLGGGITLGLVACAIVASPMFDAAGTASRAPLALIPGVTGFVSTIAGWLLIRPRS